MQDLKEYIASLDYSGLDIIIAVSKASNLINDYHPDPRRFVSASLAAFASIVSKGIAGNIDESATISPEVLSELWDNSAAADGLSGSDPDEPTSLEAVRLLCRVSGLQSVLQGEMLCRLVRFAYILGIVDAQILGFKQQPLPEFPGNHDFTHQHLQDQYTLLFWMLSNRSHGLSFTTSDLLSAAEEYPRISGVIKRSLHELAFTETEARQHEKRCSGKGIIGFAIPFDLMVRKPLLELGNGRYIRMPGAFQQLAASHGLFFRYRQFLIKKRGLKDLNAENALAAMGKRFEYYCFRLLQDCLPGMKAFQEVFYDSGHSKKTPDGVFCGLADGQIVIMQAKLKPPSGGLLIGDISIDLEECDLKNAYAEMFCESIRFLHDINKLRFEGKIANEAEELASYLSKTTDVQLICLAPTLPPIFHWGPGHALLVRTIFEKLSSEAPEALDTLREMVKDGTISCCLLLSDPEPFEIFSYKKPGTSVLPYIKEWWQGISTTSEVYEGIPQDLREHIVDVSGDLCPTQENLVGALWDSLNGMIADVLGHPIHRAE